MNDFKPTHRRKYNGYIVEAAPEPVFGMRVYRYAGGIVDFVRQSYFDDNFEPIPKPRWEAGGRFIYDNEYGSGHCAMEIGVASAQTMVPHEDFLTAGKTIAQLAVGYLNEKYPGGSK